MENKILETGTNPFDLDFETITEADEQKSESTAEDLNFDEFPGEVDIEYDDLEAYVTVSGISYRHTTGEMADYGDTGETETITSGYVNNWEYTVDLSDENLIKYIAGYLKKDAAQLTQDDVDMVAKDFLEADSDFKEYLKEENRLNAEEDAEARADVDDIDDLNESCDLQERKATKKDLNKAFLEACADKICEDEEVLTEEADLVEGSASQKIRSAAAKFYESLNESKSNDAEVLSEIAKMIDDFEAN